MAPLVSVVIVAHQSAGWLDACLSSVLAQEVPGGFEVIVVDNGPDDGTRVLLEKSFPAVRYVKDANRGFGAGNNLGARVAHGDRIVFLNPDTVVEEGALARLVGPLSEPGVATTPCIVLYDEPKLVNTCGNLLHFTGLATTQGLRQDADAFRGTREVPGVSGACFAFRRDDWARVGGFDEEFFLYVEDTDLSWRARRAGMKILLVGDARVRHSYAFRVTPAKLRHLEKGRIVLLRKHLTRRDWLAYAPSLLAAEGLAWGVALSHGVAGLKAKAQATREAWRAPATRRDLPRLPPRAFARRTLPFAQLRSDRAARAAGWLANAIFRLNTLSWDGP